MMSGIGFWHAATQFLYGLVGLGVITFAAVPTVFDRVAYALGVQILIIQE